VPGVLAKAKCHRPAWVVNTVICRSPPVRICRDDSQGSGEAVPAAPVQPATKTPSRAILMSPARPEGMRELSSTKVSTSGADALLAAGAVI
jgi:hypothetical protein